MPFRGGFQTTQGVVWLYAFALDCSSAATLGKVLVFFASTEKGNTSLAIALNMISTPAEPIERDSQSPSPNSNTSVTTFARWFCRFLPLAFALCVFIFSP